MLDRKLQEDGIAVIAMACRVPGADDPEQFWQNILGAHESILPVADAILSNIPNYVKDDPCYVKMTSSLENIDKFDAGLFGFTPREVEVMDPQQRIFFECCYEAFESAGYNPNKITENIGVFAGSAISTYLLNNLWRNESAFDNAGEAAIAYGNDKDYLSTAISYRFNLKGPSLNINTACSTSLVAIVNACKSLLTFECDAALAGGVRIDVPHGEGYQYKEGSIFSPDGHCRAFDEQANGTVFGSGAGVVLLKRLQDAINDGDNIAAVIRGSALNNDGGDKVGFTAPGIEGQSRVIREAIDFAEADPESIGYVEAHGTGTKTGDPIEIAALTDAFDTEKKQFCAVGSVKSNLGHLVTAAGVIGFIKAVKALQHKVLPPSINFNAANPDIQFEDTPFYINTIAKPWDRNDTPRRAGISSFGIGGTNAHVILEEAPEIKKQEVARKEQLLLLSARSKDSLNKLRIRLRDFLKLNTDVNLADVCHTLQIGRAELDFRNSISFSSYEEVLAKLSEEVEIAKRTEIKAKVGFCFSGQGSQYVNMGRGLYLAEPVFKETLDECAALLAPILALDIRDVIFVDENHAESLNRIFDTRLGQPILFAIEYALAKQWQKWGVSPDVMIGHSLGEYVAACIAQVMSLKDALTLVCTRASLMQSAGAGAMLSVGLSPDTVSEHLTGELSIAAINGSNLCVISGLETEIATLQSRLDQLGVQNKRLKTPNAFHSTLMDGILPAFIAEVSRVELNVPKVKYISNVTGDWITPAQATDPEYWAQHLRLTVDFNGGLKTLAKTYEKLVLIEIGPGNTLTQFVKKTGLSSIIGVNSLGHPAEKVPDLKVMLKALGAAWCHGIEVDWRKLNLSMSRQKVALPTYPFERESYWIAPAERDERVTSREAIEDWLYLPSWQIIPSIINKRNKGTDQPKALLIFTDQVGMSQALKVLAAACSQEILTVVKGEHFERLGDGYEINPANKDDFDLLITDVKTRLDSFEIYYGWGLDVPGDDEWQLDPVSVETNYYCPIYLTQALNRQYWSEPVRLTLLCARRNLSISDPSKSLMAPLAKVIGQESASIKSRFVELIGPEPSKLVDGLAPYLQGDYPESHVAFDGEFWWKPAYEPLPLSFLEPVHKQKICNGGTYLISGGLSGLGLSIAEWMASNYNVNLVLLGRRGIPAKENWAHLIENSESKQLVKLLSRLSAIENSGSLVEIHSVDIANTEMVQRLVGGILGRRGSINGVIHSAGIASEKIMARKSSADLDSMLDAKVYGTWNLYRCLRDQPLSFFLMNSSISSILGGVGQSGYSSVNRFLESFATYMQRQGMPYIAISWDTWSQSGMAVNSKVSAQLETEKQYELSMGLSDKEGLRLLEAILENGECAHIVVSTRELQRRLKQVPRDKNLLLGMRKGKVYSRPKTAQVYETTLSAEEDVIADVWRQLIGIDKVGRLDNFFDLGGDSVIASQILARLKGHFDVDLTIVELLNKSTLKDLASHIAQLRSDSTRAKYKFEIVSRPEQIPLSYSQKNMWLQHKTAESDVLYNMPVRIDVEGTLNQGVLSACLDKVINKHEILRTQVKDMDGEPYQYILENVALTLPVTDLSTFPPELQEKELLQISEEMATTAFVLEHDLLVRAKLVILRPLHHVLFITTHHMLCDAWSGRILRDELLKEYRNHIQPGPTSNSKESNDVIQFADFGIWQRRQVEQKCEWVKQQLDYWTNKLENAPSLLDIPTDFPRGNNHNQAGDIVHFELSSDLIASVAAYSRKSKITPYMLLLSAYKVLLSRYSGQKDIVVGTPISNRHYDAKLESSIGPYVNTVALRTEFNSDDSFEKICEQVKTVTLEAFENLDLPFEMIVSNLEGRKQGIAAQLFQTMFVLQNVPNTPTESDTLSMRTSTVSNGTSKFDLIMFLEESQDGFSGQLEFNTNLFKKSTAERIVLHFALILEGLLNQPTQPVNTIEYLTPQEQNTILGEWIQHPVDYPTGRCVHEYIEDVARALPDNVALRDGDRVLTYRQLYSASNALASTLLECGVSPNELVAVIMGRGWEQVVAVMAIMISGAAYIPINMKLPEERKKQLIQISKAKVALISDERMKLDTSCDLHHVTVDQELLKVNEWVSIPAKQLKSDLAYVIFTSGSTGVPKGVAIEHRAVVNTLFDMNARFHIMENDKVLALSELNFDLSVYDIFGTLMAGAELVLLSDDEVREPESWLKKITQSEITIWNSVPALMQMLVDYVENIGVTTLGKLRHVWMSGDWIPPELPDRIRALGAGIKVTSLGGATEASIWSISYPIEETTANWISIPYGQPLSNQTFYVLNEVLTPCPTLVEGDLYIGGVGVAQGYWADQQKTDASFIFNQNTGERLYRTGDRGRWLDSGQIQFLGRLDNQVKIRGMRIELGEIEDKLRQIQGVKEALVIADTVAEGSVQLVAYLIRDTQQSDLCRHDIAERLAQVLPDYMVPRYIEIIEALALTDNGKVDRKALPKPTVFIEKSTLYAAPSTENEHRLVNIWQQVFNIEKVGIDDNFFAMGGDSILSIQIISRANRNGMSLNVRDVFNYPSIRRLAEYADTSFETQAADQSYQLGEIPLTPIQSWFFEQGFTQGNHFNQAQLLSFAADVTQAQLAPCLEAIFNQHDILRTRFQLTSNGNRNYWTQSYLLSVEDLLLHNVSRLDLKEVAAETQQEELNRHIDTTQKTLDIENGPLHRWLWIDMSENHSLLLIVVHHLLIDGVSWRILLDDLQIALKQTLSGESIELGAKSGSYRQWSDAVWAQAKTDKYREQVRYWQQLLDAPVDMLPVQKVPTQQASMSSSTLIVDSTNLMAHFVDSMFVRVETTIVYSALRAVGTIFGGDRILIDLESHGRGEELVNIDVSRTLGWFTQIHPVYFDLQEQHSVTDKFVKVCKTLSAVPDRGVGYGLSKYCHAKEEVKASSAQIQINYLGRLSLAGANEAMFKLLHGAAGRSIAPNNVDNAILKFDAYLLDSELTIKIGYRQDLLDEQTINSLKEAFGKAYNELLSVELDKIELMSDPSKTSGMLAEIVSLSRDQPHPLSLGQQKLWYLYQLDKCNPYYNITSSLLFDGNVKKTVLEAAIGQVINRHDVLRSKFFEDNSGTWQQRVEKPTISLAYEDIAEFEIDVLAEHFIRIHTAINEAHYDLEQADTVRAILVKVESNLHVLLFGVHHIVADAWSVGLLKQQINHAYASLLRGQIFKDDIEQLQYGDFSRWQREYFSDALLEKQFAYWKNKLEGSPDYLTLPTDKPRPAIQTYEGHKVTELWEHEFVGQLKAVAQQQQCSLYMLLLGAFHLLLANHSGQKRINVGIPITSRHYDSRLEQVIGFFINTQVISAEVDMSQPFDSFLANIKSTCLDAYANQEIPFEMLAERLAAIGDMSHSPLFQAFFNMINNPYEDLSQEEMFAKHAALLDSKIVAKFDISLYIKEIGGELKLDFVYNKDLFWEDSIRNLLQQYRQLLRGVISKPSTLIGDIPLQDEAAKQYLLDTFAGRSLKTRSYTCVHRRFECLVEDEKTRFGQSTALSFGAEKVSYAELNVRANRIAHTLVAHGVKPEEPVGMAVSRSINMVASILGILKAGAAFVPIDPELPDSRIAHIVHDSAINVLITDSIASGLHQFDCNRVFFVEDMVSVVLPTYDINLEQDVSLNNVAQIIYTSGSTGKPKGVIRLHKAIANRASWMQEAYPLKPEDICCHITSVSFVRSVWELFVPLCSGVETALLELSEVRNIEILAAVINQKGINRIITAPSLIRAMLTMDSQFWHKLRTLRYWFVSGEPLTYELVDSLYQKLPNIQIINLYGSTEIASGFMHYPVGRDSINKGVLVPLGKPMDHTQVYVLDEHMRLVAPGVIGQLVVGGDNLGPGYLNLPELTAKQYVEGSRDIKQRLFKTGDYVRYTLNGDLEFFGRADSQVKVNGYRIEPKEIEISMLKIEGISSVVVKAYNVKHDQATRLCAFYSTSKHIGPIAGEEIRSHLRRLIPVYMLPTQFAYVETMPTIGNGKFNLDALDIPEFSEEKREHVTPETEIQIALVNIWKEALNIQFDIGLNDDFFVLGGHSLIIAKIISRIRSRFGIVIPIKVIFELNTIGRQAAYLEQQRVGYSAEQEAIGNILKQFDDLNDLEIESILEDANLIKS